MTKAALVVKFPIKLRDSFNQLTSANSFTPDCSGARWEEIKSKFASPSKSSVTAFQDQRPPTSPDFSADTPQSAQPRAPETEDPTSRSQEEMLHTPVSRPVIGSGGKAKTPSDEHKRTSLPSPISRSGSIDMSSSKTDQKLLSPGFIGHMDAVLALPGQHKLSKSDHAMNNDRDPEKSPEAKPLKRSSSVLCGSPRKPTLQFAIQDADGFPDDTPSRLVSLKKISNLGITDFFKLIEIRSGQSEGDFDCVTLRYQWGNFVAHVVSREAENEHWKATTSKMEKIFVNAKSEFRKRKEFVVWVSCGDRTNMVEDSDEEVDGEADEMEE
jgi:hypothetical protein